MATAPERRCSTGAVASGHRGRARRPVPRPARRPTSASASPGCSRTGGPRKISSSPPSSRPATSVLDARRAPRPAERRAASAASGRCTSHRIRLLRGQAPARRLLLRQGRVRVQRPPGRRPRPADRALRRVVGRWSSVSRARPCGPASSGAKPTPANWRTRSSRSRSARCCCPASSRPSRPTHYARRAARDRLRTLSTDPDLLPEA